MEKSPHRFLDNIRNFCPIWFSLNMATGIISSLLYDYPFGGNHSRALNTIALVFYLFNLFLFATFLVCVIARYILFPQTWRTILLDPSECLFWGFFPMAGATIINVSLTVVHQYWGFGQTQYLYVLWGLWWLDCFLSFFCAFGLGYIMSTHLELPISSITPRWLLPIMTLIVASTTGQLLANALIPISTQHSLITISISLLMMSIGSFFVFILLTLWIRRLLIDGLPEVTASSSIFIPLGPCGQTGYSLLLAGQNLSAVLPSRSGVSILSDPLIGRILHILCFAFAFIFWSIELWWLLSSLITLIHFRLHRVVIPFNLSSWSFVFPNGVYALLTLQLSDTIDNKVLKILGAIHIFLIVLLWGLLAIRMCVQLMKDSIQPPHYKPEPNSADPFIQIQREFTITAVERGIGSITQV